jgi:DNA modification methylase
MKEEKNIQAEETKTGDNIFCPLDALVSLRPELLNKIHYGDSFEFLEGCPPNVFDLILEDMPYNTTACDWDVKIDLESYWKTRLRVLKPTGVIVLTASQPFTSMLVVSNQKMFKYEWVWDKVGSGNFQLANKQPLKVHENIIVFGGGNYYPVKWGSKKYKRNGNKKGLIHFSSKKKFDYESEERYPTTILEFRKDSMNGSNDERAVNCIHPTQKPVGLFEYLIRTYTNEGDLVFDGFGGSGTTAIAAYKANRNFVVVEKNEKYFKLSEKRLADEQKQLRLFEKST